MGNADVDNVFEILNIEAADGEVQSGVVNGWIMNELGKVPEAWLTETSAAAGAPAADTWHSVFHFIAHIISCICTKGILLIIHYFSKQNLLHPRRNNHAGRHFGRTCRRNLG